MADRSPTGDPKKRQKRAAAVKAVETPADPWADVAGQIADWARDPQRFIPSLQIENYYNQRRFIRDQGLLPEQQIWFDVISARNEHGLPLHTRVIGIKPRQVGWSTITNAWLFWRAYTSKDGRKILSMVNHEDTVARFRLMIDLFWKGLPPELRAPAIENNEEVIRWGHNGAGVHRLLAGGGGQGRSWTYNDLYATEMAKWKFRTSANSTAERAASPDETWASVLATMHDPSSQVLVESTGAGPYGLYYDLYQRSFDPRSRWHLVFVPWTDVARYRIPLSTEGARDLEQELTPSERQLRRVHGVSLEQLAWRRAKLDDGITSEATFDREFPLTHDQPFRTDSRNWFDLLALQAQLRFAEELEKQRLDKQKGLVEKRFHPPDPRRRYIVSCDPAGGVGGDESSIKVIRDDRVEVASWDTNTESPQHQAQQIARYSLLYGQGSRPPVIVESNAKGFGKDVIEMCESLGLNMWKNENDHYFRTSGEGNGGSKGSAYAHARELIDNEICVVSDVPTVMQLMTIVEKPNGRIEPPSESKRSPPIGHDDRADALVIGFYGMHKLGWRVDGAAADPEREATRRLLEQVEDDRRILDQVVKRRWAHA